MPIYAYRCSACGHAKDVLQKLSDPVLSTCPACGGQTFSKQVTAAGFQLKGSGWYVTDFRGGNNGASAGKDADAPAGAGDAAKPAADAPAAAPAAKSDAKADAAKPAAPSTGGSTPTTA